MSGLGVERAAKGDLVAALGLFEQLVAVPLPAACAPPVVSLPDLVEALVRLGRREAAASQAAGFERRVTDVPDLRVPALVTPAGRLSTPGRTRAWHTGGTRFITRGIRILRDRPDPGALW